MRVEWKQQRRGSRRDKAKERGRKKKGWNVTIKRGGDTAGKKIKTGEEQNTERGKN